MSLSFVTTFKYRVATAYSTTRKTEERLASLSVSYRGIGSLDLQRDLAG